VGHVRPDEVAGGEGACGDDLGELLGVLTRSGGVGAAHAEEVKHGCLGLEDGAAADGADFDRRHGDGNLEVSFEAGVGLLALLLWYSVAECMLTFS
jgi:hypothetical protein